MKSLFLDESNKWSSPRFWGAVLIVLGILPLSYIIVYLSFTTKGGSGSAPAAVLASLCTLTAAVFGFTQHKSRGVLMAKHLGAEPKKEASSQ